MKRKLIWVVIGLIGAACGWAGSSLWSKQGNLRAAARLFTTARTSGQGAAGGGGTEAGGLAPTQVVVRGQVFDVSALLDSARLGPEIERLMKALENASQEEVMQFMEGAVTGVFHLEPAQMRQFFALMLKNGGQPPKEVEKFGEFIQPLLDDGGREFGSRMERLSKRLFAEDPERALLMVEAMPDKGGREGMMREFCTALALKNPEAVLDMMTRPGNEKNEALTDNVREQGLRAAFETLAARDPAAAVARWGQLPDGKAKSAAVETIASSWAVTDPMAALGWADSLPPLDGKPAIKATLAQLGPDDLRTWLAKNVDKTADPVKGGMPHWAASKLAETDPVEAITRFAAVPWAAETEQKDWFYRDFVKSSLADPAQQGKAATAVAAMPAGPLRDKTLVEFANQYAGRSSTAAKEWATTLTPADHQLLAEKGNDQTKGLLGLNTAAADQPAVPQDHLREVNSAEPRKAAEMVSADLAAGVPPKAMQGAMNQTAYRLAVNDPGSVTAWIDSFPTAELRDQTLASLARNPPAEAKAAGLTQEFLFSRMSDPVARQKAERQAAARAAGLPGL